MTYTTEFIKAAMPIIYMAGTTVPVEEREPGMPGAARDPRTANDALIAVMDVRIAWEECEWLTLEERQCIFAIAVFGSVRAAAAVLGMDKSTVQRREARGIELMYYWLNMTGADRMDFDNEIMEEILEASGF